MTSFVCQRLHRARPVEAEKLDFRVQRAAAAARSDTAHPPPDPRRPFCTRCPTPSSRTVWCGPSTSPASSSCCARTQSWWSTLVDTSNRPPRYPRHAEARLRLPARSQHRPHRRRNPAARRSAGVPSLFRPLTPPGRALRHWLCGRAPRGTTRRTHTMPRAPRQCGQHDCGRVGLSARQVLRRPCPRQHRLEEVTAHSQQPAHQHTCMAPPAGNDPATGRAHVHDPRATLHSDRDTGRPRRALLPRRTRHTGQPQILLRRMPSDSHRRTSTSGTRMNTMDDKGVTGATAPCPAPDESR